jgi:2-polyprenyl-3-methyl-5-hydroxy-6-metoxy-1,4-benzoquinol methylase
MELSTAIRLIKKGISDSNEIQTWVDLGAGTGLFTQALATCLKAGSTIYAIDKDITALAKLETKSPSVTIKKINHDFVATKFDIELLDGILMANALHFVSDKHVFVNQMKKKLKPSGRIIIVEYEMIYGNAWVPYPINLNTLQKLGNEIGFTLTKLDEEPSVFNNAVMYSAVLC